MPALRIRGLGGHKPDGTPGAQPSTHAHFSGHAAWSADRLDHGVGVLGQASGVVVTRQAGRDGLVPSLAQLPLDLMSVPAHIATADK